MIYLILISSFMFIIPLVLAACQAIGFKKYSKDYEQEVNDIL